MNEEIELAKQAVLVADKLMKIIRLQRDELLKLRAEKERAENDYFDFFLEQLVDDSEQ